MNKKTRNFKFKSFYPFQTFSNLNILTKKKYFFFKWTFVRKVFLVLLLTIHALVFFLLILSSGVGVTEYDLLLTSEDFDLFPLIIHSLQLPNPISR